MRSEGSEEPHLLELTDEAHWKPLLLRDLCDEKGEEERIEGDS